MTLRGTVYSTYMTLGSGKVAPEFVTRRRANHTSNAQSRNARETGPSAEMVSNVTSLTVYSETKGRWDRIGLNRRTRL